MRSRGRFYRRWQAYRAKQRAFRLLCLFGFEPDIDAFGRLGLSAALVGRTASS